MTTPEPSRPLHSRRSFFIAGGASVLGAAALAACTPSKTVNTSGTVPTTLVAATAPPTTATSTAIDVGRSLARTATSVELSLAAFYDQFTAAAYVPSDMKTWGTLFGSHHSANATALQAATSAAGGKPYTKPNSYLDSNLVVPGLKLTDVTNSPDGIYRLAYQLETTAAATGTLAIATVPQLALRSSIMAVAATDSRQAYLWQIVRQPGQLATSLPAALYPLRNALPAAASVDPAKGS